MRHTVRKLMLLLITASLLGTLQAATDEKELASVRDMDVITVVAHRQPRSVTEVAGTVTVIDGERLQRDMVIDMADLVRYEPGVEVDDGSTRFGSSGFRIRGIGGNRTAVVIDNVPAADRFSVGNFADSGRGLLDLGLAERVEILRGPASTLYGSKALGGVVAVTLLDVDDVLHGQRQGHRIGLAGHTDADRLRLTAATALRSENRELLLAAAGQRGGEANLARRGDTPVDALDREQAGVLVRSAMRTERSRLRLSFDGLHETRESDLRAVLGHERFVNTTSLAGDDRRNQWRVLLDQHFESIGLIDRGHWRIWRQLTDTRQETFEQRTLAPVPVDLFRHFDFEQAFTGLGSDLESRFEAFGLEHRLGYGFELTRAELTTRRDALQTRIDTGQPTNVILGEVFPLRDFPESRVTELGIYLHDEIALWPQGPIISPGLRFEYYDLATSRDPLFDSRFPDAEVTELSTTAWLPKLGVLWPINDSVELFAQYARGFRAPPFADVNIGLDLPMFNARAIANPDLAAERGRTTEAGLRWRGAGTQAEVVAFRNDYRDFIQSLAPLGFDPQRGKLIFQSINRDDVRIEGAELRIRHRFDNRLRAELAAEWTRGEDRDSRRSLPEISPPSMIAELGWMDLTGSWEARLITTARRAQRQVEDEQGNALFSPPGHATVDLLGRWFARPDLTIGLGVFNLTDRQYWLASNVLGRPVDDPLLPLLAAPGRSVGITVNWRMD